MAARVLAGLWQAMGTRAPAVYPLQLVSSIITQTLDWKGARSLCDVQEGLQECQADLKHDGPPSLDRPAVVIGLIGLHVQCNEIDGKSVRTPRLETLVIVYCTKK